MTEPTKQHWQDPYIVARKGDPEPSYLVGPIIYAESWTDAWKAAITAWPDAIGVRPIYGGPYHDDGCEED